MKFKILSLMTILAVSGQALAQAPATAPAAPATAVKIIKLASLAPEGTTLAKGLQAIKTDVAQRTGGKVDFQFYMGGVAGDEKDAIRKMQIGQIQSAALTGVGLGMIDPEIRVLELPFLFKNYNQADNVYTNMRSYFDQRFLDKGYVLLGWAEVGFVKIFSNKPIQKKADLAGLKMWMWEGDPLSQAMYESLNVVPVPLAITDVLTSLQTGLIDGCYAPELGAIAFQWHTKVKYMTDLNLVNGTGGIVIAKAEWAKLTSEEQKSVKDAVDAQTKILIAKTRADNQQSAVVLQSAGIQIVKLTPEAQTELEGISKEVQQKLVNKLYPQTLLDKVLQLVAAAPQ